MFNKTAGEDYRAQLVYSVDLEQRIVDCGLVDCRDVFSGNRVMDYSVEEIQPNVWRVRIGGINRIVRYRSGNMSFAPWDVTSAEGRTLWSATTLESAFRWIQARTGQPVEALFAQALLEHGVRSGTSEVNMPEEASEVRKEAPGG
jgi:hypothetical protein